MPAPSTAAKSSWPPDYVTVLAWRRAQLARFELKPTFAADARAYYSTRPVAFINHWCDTFDPRNAGSDVPARMPFVMFERQAELVDFLLACLNSEESGLIEKARDMGATWVCCAVSVWLWLFWPGAAIGWGSRKEEYVDKIGDPKSIFEKMRMLVGGLPEAFLPAGFDPGRHMTYMRFVNPANESTITGEAGDNIGRGGRSLIYFKDESAHYERPEKIEAALSDNTRVQIDISSVNGIGNVFHRRREAGVEWRPGAEIPKGRTGVFVMDWRDHPAKTEEWYEGRRSKAIGDGLQHVFAQEVERNYAASVEGVIIPAEWVRASIDAHVKLQFPDDGGWGGALDVADGGMDVNALVKRKSVVLRYVEQWGERDTGVTARRAVTACAPNAPMDLQYDCIGVGSGVKAEVNRLSIDEGVMPKGLRLIPWDAGDKVQDPEEHVIPGDKNSPLNKDFYENQKAQGWWMLRRRFELTYRAITEPGFTWNAADLISLDARLPLLRQIEKELSQPTMGKSKRLRLIVNKMPNGTRSPNIGDAVMMAYWPVKRPQMIISDQVLARSAAFAGHRR